MVELLPLAQAETIKSSLLDYLGTTFALADPDARQALDEFLQDRETGMFRGPYVRLRLPFRPADDGWRDNLEWYAGHTPYGHQAAAFARLSSYNLSEAKRRPLPTLVTTGTGSGKTESFLYPILDHVQRAKRNGISGTKALILYPMNALANDQAGRLAKILTDNAEFGGITAALYTGEGGAKRTTVTSEGLITDRDIIRSSAPDILLTNYKMLDQLLLRPADADLWKQSATSLQYLVLDEFHTYDGAQGTDVAMLLRRLGQTLKSHWATDDPEVTDKDRSRPLGKITPVATSATLGDGNDPSTMLDFAHTVFGDEFTTDCVVTESRLSLAEWIGTAPDSVADAGFSPRTKPGDALSAVVDQLDPADPVGTTRVLLSALYEGDRETVRRAVEGGDPLVLDLVKCHPLFQQLIELTRAAVTFDELCGSDLADSPLEDLEGISHPRRVSIVTGLFTVLSHVRAVYKIAAPSVDVHLWIRELTRIDRAAVDTPHFAWSDDGVIVESPDEDIADAPFLPAIYCRHCNRSGWGVVLAPTGTELDADDSTIRRRALARDDRFRALIHAPQEAFAAEHGESSAPDMSDGTSLAWLVVRERRIIHQRPSDGVIAEGGAIPVLVDSSTNAGDASAKQACPSCRQDDGIRFLGSAIATMLSVSLSTLFGTPSLDPREKRALVFTDSVQDAAHRAGFVQSRSHALTLRTLLRQALGHGETDLETLAHRIIELAGDDPGARYRILPPELAERSDFEKFWKTPSAKRIPVRLRRAVLNRLLLDIELEFGLRSGVGRTLERTGSVLTFVDVTETALRAVAREAVEAPDVQTTIDEIDDDTLTRWVRGVLVHMRRRGAIGHTWFDKFRQEDGNRWWITGGRKRGEGMPGFGRGSSAPGYPILGKAPDTDLEPIASPRGWYAQWSAKALGVTASEGAVLARLLFTRLHRHDVLGQVVSKSGAQTFHLPPSSVIARPIADAELAGGAVSLICSICRDTVHAYPTTIDQLRGGPCMVIHCEGTLRDHHIDDNFYRQMYAATDIRRVVAREHTSLLPDEVRLEYETQFKQEVPPPNAPNVLVATPTLEMGIDIGDLSAVMLSSLPRTVASYLQRVGRAGRLTGNALALAYVSGRGDQLPRFTRPTDTINGQVRPPATYLDAEEILIRQFVASVADILARRPDAPHPRTTPDVLRSTAPGTYLGALISEAENRCEDLVDEFLAAFPPLDDDVIERLRRFPRPVNGPGTSELATRCHRASREWNRRIETLHHRRSAVEEILPGLREKVESPAATSEDEAELRTAEATLRLIRKQLSECRSRHWISALETFGLFPNYTLLDDTATLSVSVNWRDPETDDFEHSAFEIKRGAAQALRDFAPGSTFYANGFAIDIDAVDLGIDGEEIHQWACCARCGYIEDLTASAGESRSTLCPRCHSPAIADTGQRLAVVELRNVSAVIRREEAVIDDTRDERNRRSYTVITAADVDPEQVTRKWYVEGLGFGAKHLRSMNIRWINLGSGSNGAPNRRLGGEDAAVSLFRVCSECGKLDQATRANRPSEHRPWCSLRTALEEDTRSIALSRSMSTEGLVLRLPPTVTLGDSFAVPSLAAAILLGLRERIGGSPDHLQVTTIVDPSPGKSGYPALLLHDVVPGGTGYLADFTSPSTVWDLLHRAWSVVSSCRCRTEGKLACERCLLPFAPLHQIRYTSRSAAQHHLETLLTGREHSPDEELVMPAEMPWHITQFEPDVDDSESDLEKRFRVEFRDRLVKLGATISEKPSDRGVTWDISLGSNNQWSLRPQENVLGSKPDFLLTSSRSGVPVTAIFTDGFRYHATHRHNRLADDAEKRRNLRDAGYQVVSVTHSDVEGEIVQARAFDSAKRSAVLGAAGDQLSKSAIDLAFTNALDLLIAWMQNPSKDSRAQLAHWVPMLGILSVGPTGTRSSGASTRELALRALDDKVTADPAGDTFVWTSPHLAIAVRLAPGAKVPTPVEIAVVLDDSDSSVSADINDAWKEWLLWGNLLNFRTLPADVTTRAHLASASMQVDDDVARDRVDERANSTTDDTEPALSGPWREAYENVDESARKLVALLAESGLPVPEIGEEASGGIPLEISWPQKKVAVDFFVDDDEREELERTGWTLCGPDLDIIRETFEQKGV
ncbi:ATP-dependent helicase [Gordonia paraffinivorans]|uniref:ATP-dependent helicase n=1 Tax=Gordonia paraffinivorans TaxID=175628 RepID=A0ABD7UYL0_9ACTN|nr:DEAD/DEAH box helicase [Gordonia paraffinivorans]VFA81761.1 ATP-dependent helicase [Gordonia paraffinivorans]